MPSAVVAEPPVSEDDGQNIPVIVEPPVSDEDTRPRQPVTATPMSTSEPDVPAAIIPPDLDEEPEFLVDLSRFEPPREPSDTKPRPPVDADSLTEMAAEPAPESPAELQWSAHLFS